MLELAPLLIFPAYFALVCAVSARVGIWFLQRRPVDPQAHWTERARRAFTLRMLVAGLIFALPVAGTFLLSLVRFSRPGVNQVHLIFLSALAGILATVYVASSKMPIPAGCRRGFIPSLKSALCLLFYIQPALLLFLGWTVMINVVPIALWPLQVAFTAVLWQFLRALAVTIAIGRALGLVKPVPPELAAELTSYGSQAGISPIRLYLLPMRMMNAFAWVGWGALGLTEPLAGNFPPAEIKAIAAHELGHLNEAKATVRKRALVSWLLPVLLMLTTLWMAKVIAVWAWAGLAGGLLFGFSKAIRRFNLELEGQADAFAHRLNAGDGTVLARALERLYELNLSPAVIGKKNRTHPELYDRLIALGVTPTFPRPEPPSSKEMQDPLRVALVIALLLFGPAAFWLSQPAGWGTWASGVSRLVTGQCYPEGVRVGRSIASIPDRCGFSYVEFDEDDD